MPIDVTAKRVGNILGCATHTVTKTAMLPPLATPIKNGNEIPGSEASIKPSTKIPAAI